MRHARIIGLALVAALAIGVVGAASASAALPEYAKLKVKFTTTGGTATFKTAESDIVCKKNKGSGGEVTAAKVAKGLVITFEECREEKTGIPCSNIKTNKLQGELYYINAAKHEVGTALKPQESGKPFATFTCFFTGIEVVGCSVGELSPVNTLVSEFTAKFEPSVKPSGCTGLTSKHEGKEEAAEEIAEGKIIDKEGVTEEIKA